MSDKSKLTIDQVALLAGVSRSVVSRVLNNRPRVSQEARDRVLKVIEEHDYRPSSMARGLAVDRTFEICLIMPRRRDESIANAYWPLLHLGISERCISRGYFVSLAMISADTTQEIHERILKERVFDGYILLDEVTELVASGLAGQNVPMVLIGGAPEHPGLSAIDVDNFEGAYRATRHLADLGHRRIGVILGDRQIQESLERRRGYLQVLQEEGIAPDPEIMAAGSYSEQSGYETMRGWIAAGRHPTAVFCGSDAIANGVLLALYEAGIPVPQAVSVVGFDDVPSSAFLTPPLTTIRQPIYGKGQMAADLIMDAIEGVSAETVQIRLPPELIVRRSTAAPHPAGEAVPSDGRTSHGP